MHLRSKIWNQPDVFTLKILGCIEGRSTDSWIDFDFFGHQLSAHVSSNLPELDYCGEVDGVKVPIPHFGCVVQFDQFEDIKKRLQNVNISFIVQPQIRFKNLQGEQWTMFVLDYSGNPLEFKSFVNHKEIFSQ